MLEAARTMQEAQVRHLPVLDEGEIAGMVSMRDLFAALILRSVLTDGPDRTSLPTVVSSTTLTPSGTTLPTSSSRPETGGRVPSYRT